MIPGFIDTEQPTRRQLNAVPRGVANEVALPNA
jgi:hypothetical protein